MTYDLRSADVPRLTGASLRALAAAIENPITAPLLLRKLLKDAGFGAFRTTRVDDVPLVLPWLPRPASLADAPAAAPVDPFLVAARPSPPAGFAYETTADFARAYRERRVTPVDVARRLLAAIQRGDEMDPPLRAIIACRQDDVLAQAERSAARWSKDQPLSPLDGVPVAVKDELDVATYPTTAGTSIISEVAAADAAAVARLRAAGALIYGKANMIEIGIDTLGFNAHYGTPRNPAAADRRYTGGSSSGSGAAVAAGLGPIAVGADGGGSIRIPAALCGVAGLKATHGRISELLGVFPLCWSVGHVGPIGATVRDVALAYHLMAGPVDGDRISQAQPPPTLAGLGDTRLDGLRIGLYRAWFEDADPGVVAAARAAVDGLVARGARLVDVEIPDLELCRIAHAVTILGEMVLTMARYADRRRDQAPAVRINLALARALTASDYVQAQRVRTRMTDHFARAFERCDVIATPTTAITAPPIKPDIFPSGESNLATLSALMRFVFPPNLTGHPALSVPVGHDANGLPVGLQLIGRPWEEHVLLRVGDIAESLAPRRKPAVWFSLLA